MTSSGPELKQIRPINTCSQPKCVTAFGVNNRRTELLARWRIQDQFEKSMGRNSRESVTPSSAATHRQVLRLETCDQVAQYQSRCVATAANFQKVAFLIALFHLAIGIERKRPQMFDGVH